jgi:hypothetical protein
VAAEGSAAAARLRDPRLGLSLTGAFVFVYALGRRRRLAETPSVAYGRIGKNNVPVNTTAAAPELSLPEMLGHPN